jgi:hypothetical protein
MKGGQMMGLAEFIIGPAKRPDPLAPPILPLSVAATAP